MQTHLTVYIPLPLDETVSYVLPVLARQGYSIINPHDGKVLAYEASRNGDGLMLSLDEGNALRLLRDGKIGLITLWASEVDDISLVLKADNNGTTADLSVGKRPAIRYVNIAKDLLGDALCRLQANGNDGYSLKIQFD